MTLVNLYHKTGRLNSQMLGELTRALPAIVADALHSAENTEVRLTEQEVEVCVRESGPYDVNIKDVGIHVMANLYPGREANLDTRKNLILEAISAFFVNYGGDLSVGVLVTLHPAAYGEL